jgi:hypothetical protein
MSDGSHLLIPFAASTAQGCRKELGTLALPHLERLLARLAPADPDEAGEDCLSMPHERVLARECGLAAPDGLLPWAAWTLAQSGGDPGTDGWAWITPCHWQVATDHILMHPPGQLQLDAEASRELLRAMAPYFQQDGLALEYDQPMRWRARGALFAQLPCASLDRVAGRTLDRWLPRGAAAAPLRRLQQEMQMLLYTHPVNDQRLREGLLPVNSFWASGAGVLPAGATKVPARLRVIDTLREPALAGDWAAWAAAWRALDEHECAALHAALEKGLQVALTLGGERQARTWSSAGSGWRRRLASAFRRPRLADTLSTL